MKRIVRWTGTIFGLIVFVLLVIIAWGTGLPMYHIATCSADIRQSPQELFAVVRDDANSPKWRSDVVSVLLSPALNGSRPIWVETNRNGQSVAYVQVRTISGREIDREIADKNLPYGGQWKYRFDADGTGGTTLTISEFGVIYNPVFRFVERYFLGYTSTLRTFITDLGRKYGESPAVSCKLQTMRSAPNEIGPAGKVPLPNAMQPALKGSGY